VATSHLPVRIILKRTMECMSRTFAAALKPGLKRAIACGMAVAVKKLAVSKTRRTDLSSVSVPVIVIGKAVYLFIKVAMNAPRMAKGDIVASGTR